ncbi:VWA domain-containing protein [uncultured Piscinibacter sp.]|uniref:vWA domain-containing protein n=1 Tax=uncultured Piscinibacter sp. TaxID=1131835 RepID=UPI002625FBA2|nr:VWA domain-containing protein [uncultured Piscinibacter sp.]
MNEALSLNTQVILTPLNGGLHRETELVDVLVRIQSPDAPAGTLSERPPQALSLVLDRSGSMSGRPLAEARRCVEYVVGRLRPTDIVGLVVFDNRITELHPPQSVGDGDAIRAAIAQVVEGGATNLHGGWRHGADALVALPGIALRRVILLSDGKANAGPTKIDEIAPQCAELAAAGVTTSTCGLGEHFHEDLMVEMARAGRGNSYYGDTAEDLMDPFVQELDLLGNLCLSDLRLSVTVPEGVTATMLNDLQFSDGTWRLPDLAWGAEAWPSSG